MCYGASLKKKNSRAENKQVISIGNGEFCESRKGPHGPRSMSFVPDTDLAYSCHYHQVKWSAIRQVARDDKKQKLYQLMYTLIGHIASTFSFRRTITFKTTILKCKKKKPCSISIFQYRKTEFHLELKTKGFDLIVTINSRLFVLY